MRSFRTGRILCQFPTTNAQIPTTPNAQLAIESALGVGNWELEVLFGGESMLRGLRAGDDLVHRRLLAESARDRFLRRLVVVVVDLLIVACLPVDEHTHEDAQVISPVLGDDAAGNRVDHS